jgi:hypothetical protein
MMGTVETHTVPTGGVGRVHGVFKILCVLRVSAVKPLLEI